MTGPPVQLVVYDPAARLPVARITVAAGSLSVLDPSTAPAWVREAVAALSGKPVRRLTSTHQRTLRNERHARIAVDVGPEDASWPQAVAQALAREARAHDHAVGVAG